MGMESQKVRERLKSIRRFLALLSLLVAVACVAAPSVGLAATGSEGQPVYRALDTEDGAYYYTTIEADYRKRVDEGKWLGEGICMYALNRSEWNAEGSGKTRVYEFYPWYPEENEYTFRRYSTNLHDAPDEWGAALAWYSPETSGYPVYEFRDATTGCQVFTANPAVAEALRAQDQRFTYVGTPFYSLAQSDDAVPAVSVDMLPSSVVLEKSALMLREGGSSSRIYLSGEGPGTLGATSSNPSVATATMDGSSVTVTPVGRGTCTITVTRSAQGLYEAGSDTLEVTVSPREGLQVPKRTVDEITKRAQELRVVDVDGELPVYDVDPVVGTDYNPGRLSKATMDEGTAILNLYRYVAGVRPVSLSTDERKLSQVQMGALISAANGTISHSPERVEWMSEEDWSLGRTGCATSNIAMGAGSLGSALDLWITDPGSNNWDELGHRLWFMTPSLSEVAWGMVDYYSVGGFETGGRDYLVTDYSWPAQTQPIELWTPGAQWHICPYSDTGDLSNIRVTLTRRSDGRTWHLSEGDTPDGHLAVSADEAIIFKANDLDENVGESFHVKVDGLSYPLEYDVDFVDVPGISTAWNIDSAAADRYVLRLYNRWTGEHLFTKDGNEVKELLWSMATGWKYEGLAWEPPASSSTPVHRIFNRWTNEHLYTADRNEISDLTARGWTDEGPKWYSDDAHGVPVYRLYNPYNPPASSHHYTTDLNEYNTLASQGWRPENVQWYGISS